MHGKGSSHRLSGMVSRSRISSLMLSMFATFASLYVAGRFVTLKRFLRANVNLTCLVDVPPDFTPFRLFFKFEVAVCQMRASENVSVCFLVLGYGRIRRAGLT